MNTLNQKNTNTSTRTSDKKPKVKSLCSRANEKNGIPVTKPVLSAPFLAHEY